MNGKRNNLSGCWVSHEVTSEEGFLDQIGLIQFYPVKQTSWQGFPTFLMLSYLQLLPRTVTVIHTRTTLRAGSGSPRKPSAPPEPGSANPQAAAYLKGVSGSSPVYLVHHSSVCLSYGVVAKPC